MISSSSRRFLLRTTAAVAVAAGLAASFAVPATAKEPDDVPVTISLPSTTREVFVTDAAITSPTRETPIYPGDTLTGYWTGVQPRNAWTVWLMPGNRPLGATEVGASGRAPFSVSLPSDLAPGDYWLELAQPIPQSSSSERTTSQWLVRPALTFTVFPAVPTQAPAAPPAAAPVAPAPGAVPPPPAPAPGGSTSTGGGSAPVGAAGGQLAPADLPAVPQASRTFLSLSGLSADYSGTPNPFQGSATVELTLSNSGTQPVSGEVEAWITDVWGRTLGDSPATRVTDLAPGAVQTVTLVIPDVGQAGMLTAHARMTPDVPADATEEQKAQLAPVTREAVVWALPLVPLGGVVLLALLGTVLWVVARRGASLAEPQGALA